MIRSPVSPADARIRTTIDRYQETFNSGDRESWLDLFSEDAVLEDPAGSHSRRGRAGLSAFWDEIHDGKDSGADGLVRMIQGPAVCGLEAAWAFQLRIPRRDRTVLVEIIDQASFTEDGRIHHLRAFWSEATIRVE
jgi:steroid delta-isomerase